MAPVRPEATRSTSASNAQQDDQEVTQQAGRSATALAAASSAFNLRLQASRSNTNLRPSSSTPNLLRKKSKPQTHLQDIGDEPESEDALAAPNFSRPSASASPKPRAPALLIQTSSNESSSSSRVPSRAQSAEHSPEVRPADALLPASAKIPIPPIPLDERPPMLKRPMTGRSEISKRDSQLSLARLGTPRSVRDLGQDYDRYYNPFASRQNSQLDLSKLEASAALMTPGSRSSTDLLATKRYSMYSNPFGDHKRYSSAWHSNVSTRPASPVNELNEKDVDSHVAAFHGGPLSSTDELDEKPGTPELIRNADPEKGFYTYVDDRLGAEHTFPLFVDTQEDDDDLHMPAWDDDIKMKPKLRDHFTRENICSTIGMVLMICGLLCVFVILPVISYTGTSLIPYGYNTPLSEMPGIIKGVDPSSWAYVNSNSYPLLGNIRQGLIDPDTPSSAMTRTAFDGSQLKLVFSDEFNTKNRTFYPGDDPYWYGFDGWYGATQDLEWYDPDALNTGDGVLEIGLDQLQFLEHGLKYRSGMMHSWNQLCFKGGVFEVSVSLPGPAGKHLWWPGAWTMGNLGRPGYLSTTDGSDPSGISRLPGQRLASCTCDGEDHPNPGTGRGAPEIDILEASADWNNDGLGVATQSFQVAPFDVWYYPDYQFFETPIYSNSFVNTYTGGPFQQAVSTTTMLNNSWYDGENYQKYAFEYSPGGGQDAYIQWYVGDQETMRFDGRAIGPNGNVGQRLVSEEPMSMVLNLGFSQSWVNIDWAVAAKAFPAFYRIDYVRWYQDPDSHFVTCDPPGYPTTEYIANHAAAYNNPNLTLWSQTPYSQPKNTLMNGCQLPVG